MVARANSRHTGATPQKVVLQKPTSRGGSRGGLALTSGLTTAGVKPAPLSIDGVLREVQAKVSHDRAPMQSLAR